MATRNLTKKFLEIRSAAKANRNLGVTSDPFDEERGEKGLLRKSSGDASDSWKANRNALPPNWVERMELVEEDISKIRIKMQELSGLHSKRLMVNFESDEAEQEREIEQKTDDITQIFHHAQTILQKFSKKADDMKVPVAERTVRKNMQMNMAKRLQALTMNFRASQKQYMGRLNSQKKGGSSQLDFLTENDKKAAAGDFVDQGFTTQQMIALEDVEALVNERDEEITKIAKSIEELASIFKELAVLVIDQGTILDRIDYNMENAVEHAKEGIKQLEKAEDNQKNAMSVKCIIVLVLLIAVMIGILVWKHSPSSSSSSSSSSSNNNSS